MNSKYSCFVFAVTSCVLTNFAAWADSKTNADMSFHKKTKLDFRPSIGPKVGVAGGGCEIGAPARIFSTEEECENIKRKISERLNQSSNRILKESLTGRNLSCVVSLNGAGGIIDLNLRQSSGSTQLDKQVREFLRNSGHFQINKTWELKQHEYVVEFPEITVKTLE